MSIAWFRLERLSALGSRGGIGHRQWNIGVSSEGHAVMSVKVRPEPKDSGSEAREALWRESKTAEPSDNILERSMREASGCNVQ